MTPTIVVLSIFPEVPLYTVEVVETESFPDSVDVLGSVKDQRAISEAFLQLLEKLHLASAVLQF